MDSYFEHPKAVIDYAWQLVREYNDWQKEQDKIEREKANGKVVRTDRE
jgi:hypothetical protein